MAKRNLRRVKIENFRSFSTAQEVIFTAETKYSSKKANDASLIKVANGTQDSILPVTVLYGANAAGKSNFLKIFGMLDGLLHRMKIEPSKALPYEPFDAGEYEAAGTNLEMEFVINDQTYLYCVHFDEEKIKMESLSVLNEKLKFDELYCVSDGKFFPKDVALSHVSRDEVVDWLKTRRNITVLEILGTKNVEPYVTILDFLRMKRLGSLAQRLYEDQELREMVLSFVREIDVGITDIFVDKDEATVPEFLQKRPMPEEFVRELTEMLKYRIKFKHVGLKQPLDIWDESDGTMGFIKHVAAYLPALLKDGGVFYVDEIEDSMHPFIVRLILGMFQDSRINKMGAQLICSTHDIGLQEPEILRRDEIWFVQKDSAHGNSTIYPLSQFTDVRQNTKYKNKYIDGEFGAIPYLSSLDTFAGLVDGGK